MFYKYQVDWYSKFEDKEITSEGIVFASTISDAARYVSNDYDDAFDIHIKEMLLNSDESHCIEREEIDHAFEHD